MPLCIRLWPWLVFLAVLTACSLLTFRGIMGDPGSRVYAENDDTSLFVWWFANGADAVASLFGRGSGNSGFLYTTQMNWPDGVNGAWNTSVLGLAIPLSPVTWLWGPVVAYSVAIVCSPIAAAGAAALFFTRFADRLPAFVGATLYGFSPYLVAQAGGHLNLSFAVLPPLVAVFLWKAVTGATCGSVRSRIIALAPWGIILGGAIGWQFYVSTELLAGTFLAAVVAVLGIAAVMRRRMVVRLIPAVVASICAVVTALMIAAPLLTTMLFAQNGPAAAIRPHGVWNNDLADLVVPTATSPLAGLLPEIPRVMHIDSAEVGGYMSVAWLVVGVWAACRHWRSPRHGLLVRVLVISGAGVWLLSMGSPLRFFGTEWGMPGPFRIVEYIPVLMNILPMRLAVHVTLALGALTAVFLHHALRDMRRARLAKYPLSARVVASLAAVVVTGALLAPTGVPYRTITIPSFFSGDAVTAVLPKGAVVKALPTPRAIAEQDYAQSMVWQAATGMHYKETGGYFIGGTDDHDVIYQSLLDPLDQLLRQEASTPVEDFDPQAVDSAVRGIRASGTEFVLIPVDPPLLHWPADGLARMLADTPGASVDLVEDVWVVDLRGVAL